MEHYTCLFKRYLAIASVCCASLPIAISPPDAHADELTPSPTTPSIVPHTPIGKPITSPIVVDRERWQSSLRSRRLLEYLLHPNIYHRFTFSSFTRIYRSIMQTELARSSYTFEFLWNEADSTSRQTLTVSVFMGNFLSSGKVNLTYRF